MKWINHLFRFSTRFATRFTPWIRSGVSVTRPKLCLHRHHIDSVLTVMLCQRNCNRFNKMYYYRPETKLWKGNVFTSVCQEFCPRGWTRQTPTRQTPSWADTPLDRLGRHPHPRQIHLQADIPLPADGYCSGRHASS